jgi:hypothetical protein
MFEVVITINGSRIAVDNPYAVVVLGADPLPMMG